MNFCVKLKFYRFAVTKRLKIGHIVKSQEIDKQMLKKITLFLLVPLAFQAQTKKWSLQECVEYAMENNISIESSGLDLKNSEIDKKDALGNFLPSVNASASHSWNIGLNQNITTGLLENQTTQFTSAGFNVGIDVFKGLQNQNRLRRSNLALIASRYQLTKMKEDVALNIANAYLQILFNKENLKIQQEQLKINNEQLSRTQELVDAGMVPKGDLLDIQATVASNQKTIITAENTLLISKLSLAQLLKIKDFMNFDVAEEESDVFQSPVLNESFDIIVDKAKAERTDLKIAQSNLEIAQKDIAIARGSYYPTISGFYAFNTRAAYSDRVIGVMPDATNPTSVIGYVDGTGQNVLQQNFSPIIGGPASVWDQFKDNKGQNFGLQISVPIFNGFSVRNNVQRSKVAYEKAKLNLDQQELDLERNVFTAYTDTKAAKETYEASLKAFEARKLSYEYASERYAIGLMNVFDFNQAQTALANAESDVLNAKYDYIFRTKILEFYFGIPIIQNN